jgi:hypothetical protein
MAANTPVKFTRPYPTSLTAKLVSVGGTGTPNAAGYACTSSNGLQSLTVAEALVGAFYIYAYDAGSEIAYSGFVVLADDTTTYYGFDDLTAANNASTSSALTAAIKAKTDLIGTIRSLIRW